MAAPKPVLAMPGYGWKHMPLASAVSYSVISIAITLINKAVLSSYCACPGRWRRAGGSPLNDPPVVGRPLTLSLCTAGCAPAPAPLLLAPPLPPCPPAAFTSTMTLTLLQGLVTVVCLEIMRRAGWVEYQPFSWDIMKKVRVASPRVRSARALARRALARALTPPLPPLLPAPPRAPPLPPRAPPQVAPLSFVFIGYVVISLVSLGRVNVPMFTALRRLTILFVMAEEWFLLDISPSRMVSYTVGVQFLGAAIAGWYDLTFDPVSYFYLFLTNLFTSLYTVYISVVRKKTGLNVFAMMYYNNVTTMPFLAVLAWYTGDIATALAFPHYGNVYFMVNFALSVFLAFLLNLSTFYCTSLNTARTQTVVGQLKNFAAFLLGLLLFDDYIYEPYNFLGLWIGFAGSVWYAFVVADEKGDKPAAAPAPAAAASTPSKLPGVLDTIKEEEDLEMAASASATEEVRKRQR